MDSYAAFNHILVKLFNDIMDIEEKSIITDTFRDITNNDMHVIEAIGIGTPKNMSAIAKQLRVTTGTLTISMNSLVKKGYVVRSRSEQDRRIVYISLTEKGRKAYYHHENFHREMINAAMKNLSEEELPLLARTLNGLAVFFRNYGEYREELPDRIS